MPKRIIGWECSKCHTFYNEEKNAQDCENSHPKIEDIKLDGIFFSDLNDKYGPERGMLQHIPSKIKIKISEASGDFALYKLDNYGYRGV